MYVLGDIGGTKTRVAITSDCAVLSDVVKYDTPQDPLEGVSRIVAAAHSLGADARDVRGVATGIAGPIKEGTILVNSPNLPRWIGAPIVDEFKHAFGTEHVHLVNDSALVGLGEAHFGAGKGDDIVAYITVSTGVGGARIVDGRIDRSVFGFEPGHQVLDIDGTVLKTVTEALEAEDMVSGTATAERFGKKAYEVHDPEVWEELARWLAYVLNNTIVHWSPRSVVLGGSMIVGEPAIPVDRVEHHLGKILRIFPERPALKKAVLEDKGGLYGGMALLRAVLEH